MSSFQGSTLYYFINVFKKASHGRGEPVRLLLIDAGIDFTYERVDSPASGDRIPTMPYITTKTDQLYGRTAPLMRRICKELGNYIPSNSEDEYLVDSYSDLYLDWRSKWMDIYFFYVGNQEVKASYDRDYRPFQYSNWNNILDDRSGPYVIGEEITYVDFMLYSILRDDNESEIDAVKYPNIDRFIKTFEARPALKGKLEY